MPNVNNMEFNQLAAVLTEIVGLATGTRPPTPVNASEFVSVGQLALKVGYDPLNTAISQVLSKTIFSIRPYGQKFKLINVNDITYGNHVRKLQTLDSAWEDDQRFELVDGQSIDHYVVNKPKVVQTNWYGANTFQRHLTRYRDQLDNALRGPEEFGSFISMIMQNAADQITQAKENMSRTTLANEVVAVYAENSPYRCINVLAEYNAFAGTTLTTSTVFNPDNYPNFVRWLYSRIQRASDFMTERSAVYHSEIGGSTIMRHTPKQAQRLFLQAGFGREMETIVTSTTYHDNKTVFPPHEIVNYWQSIENPYEIQLDAATVDANGDATNTGDITIPRLIGVLFDREALGITTVNEWAATTPLNAAGGYYNHYWHFTTRYWNDFSENAVIFYMED